VSSDSLSQAVIQSSVDGFAVMDQESRYLLWNRAMERFSGKTAEEVLGRNAFEVFPFLRDHGLDVAVARVLQGESVATNGAVFIEPDGTRKVYDRLYEPLCAPSGEITGVVCIVRDATARYAAVDALRESDTKLRNAVDAAGVGLWSWDPTADVVEWEDTMCSVFGLATKDAPKTRDAYLALLHPDDRPRAVERITVGRGDTGWEGEYRITRADGALRWVMSKARLLRVDGKEIVLGAVIDVTDRKERDDRRRAAQRLEAVGELTAGIAHNFNNLLMGILPTLDIAARTAPASLTPLLDVARSSAQAAADLVRQLVTYAGRNRPSVRYTEEVMPLVERTIAFCRTTFDRRIAMEVYGDATASASFDASEIEQALLNLLINARDAVEASDVAAKVIKVTVDVVSGTTELEGRGGNWVRLEVADNGIGMGPEVLGKIFEPFFTTKPVGKGTGLGLSTTYGIVREHEGFITCRSTKNEGTVFCVFLRRSMQTNERPKATPPVERATSGTVLVVDDEAVICRVIALTLADVGIDVKTATSGDEALALLSDPSFVSRVALVLLDVSMPGLSGPETRERLRIVAPNARVVFLTGQAMEARGGDTVLHKPVGRSALLSTVLANMGRDGELTPNDL
jgi:two-component system, cell cycle sensor histidine kinase and response regulator CckA